MIIKIILIAFFLFVFAPLGFCQVTLPQTQDFEGLTWTGPTCGAVEEIIESGTSWWTMGPSPCDYGKISKSSSYNHTDGGSNSAEVWVGQTDGQGRVRLGYSSYGVDHTIQTTTLYVRYYFRTTISTSQLSPQGHKFGWIHGDIDGVLTWGSSNLLRWQFYYQDGNWRNQLGMSSGVCSESLPCAASTVEYVTSETATELWDAINDGSWHKIEFYFQHETPTAESNNGEMWFKIDDVLKAKFSGVDFYDTTTSNPEFSSHGIGGNWSGWPGGTGTYYIDDIYMADSEEDPTPDPPTMTGVGGGAEGASLQ